VSHKLVVDTITACARHNETNAWSRMDGYAGTNSKMQRFSWKSSQV
jgi:hypothetical protein